MALRDLVRKVAYSTNLYSFLGGKADHRDRTWWDNQLAGPLSAYLGGTMSIDMRNSATANLIRHHATPNPVVLDVGCAGGSLAQALGPFEHYVGVDISEVAIRHAQHTVGDRRVHFEAADLSGYELPPHRRFDVIVFNEVLYYLDVAAAREQVSRYARTLRERGIIVVSMKDDPKSQAILQELAAHFRWIESVLIQTSVVGPTYAIQKNRERPAYLIAALGVRPG
jgi:2-polyprenyl-3-methyl-5-hydroxy-6-metoxy-1,4-benzoquinol methylase